MAKTTTKHKLNLLLLIEEIWEEHPALRLCQLLGNCFEPGDLYYITDDKLTKALKEKYKNEK